MLRKPWNRARKRNLDRKKDDRPDPPGEYRVKRVYARKRKPKHPGYTVIPESRLRIMNKMKINL
jgi:hypothetical protein